MTRSAQSARSAGVMATVASLTCALVAFAVAPGCADEEILLARLPPSSEGGRPNDMKRCVDESECTASTFCARADCGDVAGTCESRPVVCEEEGMPVCGCDGVTYWNDCLRRAAGITAMDPGQCTEASGHGCGPQPGKGGGGGPEPTEGCPPGTFCARLLPPGVEGVPGCSPDVSGLCWALPAVCPDHAGPDRWLSCFPSKDGCVTTCDAIRTGEPHKRAKACP